MAISLHPSRPRCRFCHNVGSFVLPALLDARRCGRGLACAECISLVRWAEWDRLATRWLSYRPEDWSDDVAAFLELALGPKA